VDRPGAHQRFRRAKQLFHGEKFTVPQHGLQRGDAGVGAQHEDAVVFRFFRQLARVDLEGGTGGARSLAGAAEVAAVSRVADERLVALAELLLEAGNDGLAVGAVPLRLGLVAANDVAASFEADLLGEELGLGFG
jgi:hypothetical protein